MSTFDEMIDNAFNKPLPPQLTPEEMLVLHEEVHKGKKTFGAYVSPEENAKQYLAKSKQVLFAPPIKDRRLTLLQKAMRLSGF
jgi:hypothetical protein